MLKATGIHKSYALGRSEVRVLRGASIEVEAGEFIAITGASGSGKSTLLHILGALDQPDRGSVEFDGVNLFDQSEMFRRRYKNRDAGFVFQLYYLLPELNVIENVLTPRMVSHSFMSWWTSRPAARRDALALLERLGLSDRGYHRPSELSGGERQRVAMARALINRPALLLADEPTGNLDETTGDGILRLLAELSDGGQTIVMVTHDAKVSSYAHRTVRLAEGTLHQLDSSAPVTKEVSYDRAR